jgi:hypothetical protein
VRRLIRSFGVIVLSVAATVLLAGTQSMTPLVALTATALIMGGTGHPLSTPQDSPEFTNGYTNDANNDYIVLTGFCGTDSCTPTAVSTPVFDIEKTAVSLLFHVAVLVTSASELSA